MCTLNFILTCYVKDQVSSNTLLTGQLKDGLYAFNSSQLMNIQPSWFPSKDCSVRNISFTTTNTLAPLVFTSNKSFSDKSSIFTLWHNRLGHPSSSIVKAVMNTCNVWYSNKIDQMFCPACCMGKIHKFPFPSTRNTYPTLLHLMHTDLWGPSPILSPSRYKYYINFVDDYNKYTWIYLSKNKSEAFQTFCNFKSQVELQIGFKIKNVQSDWRENFDFLLSSSTPMGYITECPA